MQIDVLGPFQVHNAGVHLPVAGGRLKSLLALLALDAGRSVTNHALISGIWDDSPPSGALHALRALVSRLRRHLPDHTIESHPAGYRLALPREAVDSLRFEKLAAAGRQLLPDNPGAAAGILREALGLWRGPALEDLADHAFARNAANRLEQVRLDALEHRLTADLTLGHGPSLIGELTAFVAEHPLREQLSGLLMKALFQAGRQADALACYQRLRTTLRDELGIDPSPLLQSVHLSILQANGPQAAGLRSDVPPRPQQPGRPADHGGRTGPAEPVDREGAAPLPATNLRAQLTSFVGREQDLARLSVMTERSRLITLTGPGGVGKTRLAIELAGSLVDRFPDGVWLVDLAPVRDQEGVVRLLLAALGLSETVKLPVREAGERAEPGTALADQLIRTLASWHTLIVLDNCEHLVDTCARLADQLLAHCRRAQVIVTSREQVGITGEQLYPVEPLALPDSAVVTDALVSPAVRLFTDRAVSVRPDFAVDAGNVEAVVRICTALDGIPLPLELAAARVKSLPPQQIADRLDDRFRLLTSGSRTSLTRHQTLKAAIDWSWALLGPPEQDMLRRLSVFAGSAGLAGAEAVGAGAGLPAEDVLETLMTLVDKSLVQPAGASLDGQPRFQLLNSVRAYGLARLAESGEGADRHERHARYHLALAERAEAWLRTGQQLEWMDRLAADQENLHSAIRWSIRNGMTATAVRLVCALGWYWWLTGHHAVCAELTDQLLAMPGPMSPQDRAVVYALRAVNALGQGGQEQITTWLDAAAHLGGDNSSHPVLRLVELLRASLVGGSPERILPVTERLQTDPDPWVRAFAGYFRGDLLLRRGQVEEAEPQLERALESFRRIGERWGTAQVLGTLAGLAARRGDHQQAIARYRAAIARIEELRGTNEDSVEARIRLAQQLWITGETADARILLHEALQTAERLGIRESTALVHLVLGTVLRAGNDLGPAADHLERVVEIMGTGGVPPKTEAMVKAALGHLLVAQGDHRSALRLLAEAMALASASGHWLAVGHVMLAYADLALHAGRGDHAALLLGAAAGERCTADRSLIDLPRLERATRRMLGEQGYLTAFDRGRVLAPVDAVERVLAELSAGRLGPAPDRTPRAIAAVRPGD